MAKVSRPVIYTALLAVVVGAFVLTAEEEPAGSAASKTKRKAKVEQTLAGFDESDYKAAFPVVNESARNAFVPLIKRTEPSTLVAQPFVEGNGIPEDLAGEPSWIYTGMAEVNGMKQGLVENTATGEGEFIRQGQRWKKASVVKITPDTLTLIGTDGVVRRMRILEDATAMPLASNRGFQPVSPPLSGPIGPQNLQIQPEGRGANRRMGMSNNGNVGESDAN